MTTLVTVDHPAWNPTPTGGQARVVEHRGNVWLALWDRRNEHLALRPVTGDTAAEPPPVAYTSPIELPVAPEEAVPLLDELVRLGTVARLTNPSLWDAIVAAVLRRAGEAGQARQRDHAFRAAYGRGFATPAGELALVPTPEVVLALSDDGFAAAGAAYGGEALRLAAGAYLERGERWSGLAPEELAGELGEIPRLGPSAAAAAAADFTGDFSVSPYGDLALRNSGREVEALWRRWTPTRAQRHALALFTLAYDSRFRRGHHPVSPRPQYGAGRPWASSWV
ncbi:hypothetical protein O1L60_18430 [Streptomyces diastatochromogenes]|nr:hypothetical protein [Streptomyces diastatochromogenes]